MSPTKVAKIKLALAEEKGIRETARVLKVSAAKVSEIKRGMTQQYAAMAA